MKPHRFLLTAAALLAFLALSASRADDRTASPRDGVSAEQAQFVALQKSKPTDKKSDVKKPRKFRGRLPNYWGRIGLSESQRKKIYGVQLSYRERILMLEKQLLELREKQDAEMEAVLTSAQKKKLDELLENARKKRAARSKKRDRKAKPAKATDKAG
jgi:Spy/CpxP family protein refolding chaperone